MTETGRGFLVFEYGEEIVSFLLLQPNLNLVIDPEVHSEEAIDLPAELVIPDGRHDP